tara:strand:+ start:372 stop:533 length:162 start_codon:yes stop_codon:yes gene_type:complete
LNPVNSLQDKDKLMRVEGRRFERDNEPERLLLLKSKWTSVGGIWERSTKEELK